MGSTREYPMVRVAMHMRAQGIRNAISALSLPTGFSELGRSTIHELPFPFAGEPKPHDRFAIDAQANTFQFVGRQIYVATLEAIIFELNRFLSVNLISEKSAGKSHLVAAGVAQVMKEGKSVVYLPRAFDFALNPLDYLRAALLTNFCPQPEDTFFIMDCDSMEEMVEWCESKDFILVVDQAESLESDSGEYSLPHDLKKAAVGTLHRLCKNRPVLRCYAAGAHVGVKRFSSLDQRSERDIEIRSTYEKSEKELIEKLAGSKESSKVFRSRLVI
eukprot:Gregarina_sp_Pseudo_9__4559@NODE_472_length_2755_cov_181_646907_g436_i1_p2_GENE_NODE_472_length_2755_cov_181_646907_g436_i1NODE_472_length_2755_cov_181_646907_g436_i1_p2_ORF_typecomplete_len274_score63_21RecA/PF00154_21/0_0061IstB_IS21/PF01695_17/0_039DAP3/PF10236_9/0_064_NODE_472_length_2755_cov_181_646907_g436_i12101031